jgi:hypothetical protein
MPGMDQLDLPYVDFEDPENYSSELLAEVSSSLLVVPPRPYTGKFGPRGMIFMVLFIQLILARHSDSELSSRRKLPIFHDLSPVVYSSICQLVGKSLRWPPGLSGCHLHDTKSLCLRDAGYQPRKPTKARGRTG